RGTRGTVSGGETGNGGWGGFGGNGGFGGSGLPGAGGLSAATRSITQNGSSVPNPVTLLAKVLGGCTNSEITLSKSGGTWNLLSGAQFINDLDAATTSYNTSTGSILVSYPAIGHKDLEVSATYDKFIYIKESRAVPAITAIANPCDGNNATLTTATSGDQYEWVVFQTTTASSLGTSTSQTYNYSPSSTGTYKVRLRVYDNCCGWSVPVYSTFTVNSIPTGSIAGNATICNGESTDLTFTLSGGTGPYDVVYTDGTSNFTLNNINNGHTEAVSPTTGTNYSIVSITDNNGCGTVTVPGSVTVNVNPLPNGTISATSPVCDGDMTTLTFNFTSGTGSFNIQYSDGTTTYSLNGISSGATATHTLSTGSVTFDYTSITDANLCTRTTGFGGNAIITVNELPLGTVSGATTICEGDATDLTFNFTAGTGPYDVEYSDGSTTFSLSGISDGHVESVTPSVTTTYSITEITGQNCTNSSVSSSTVITVNPAPNGTMAVVTPICLGDQTTITFTFSPGTGPYDIEFTDGVSNFTLANVPNGGTFDVTPPTTVTYNYTSITDDLGCTRTSGFTGGAQVVVNTLPIVSFSGLAANYCEVDGAVLLTGNQAPNGSFTGNGITDLANGTALFDPATAGVGPHTITYSYTNINLCSASEDQTVDIEVQPVADAGSGGDECDLNFDLEAFPIVASGSWSQTGGPGFSQFLPSPADPNATVTVSQYGNYEFTWSEGIFCSDSDGITVNFYEQPVADAGDGGNECDLTFEFNANPSVVGSNGEWTQISGPGTSAFVDATDPATTVTVSMIGAYDFQWEEENGTCFDSETVTVNFFTQPVANPGFGGSECDLSFSLNATGSVGVGTWSATGPGTVTFTPDANTENAVADVSAYGVYIFTWSEDNFGCTDDASITVNFDQQASADAGDDGEECDLTFQFNAAPTVGTGTWTASGPGNASYSSPNDPLATVTVDAYGTYLFTWTDVNGSCTAVDFVNVTFYEQPVADAGPGGDECDLNFDFNAVDGVGDGLWLQINGPGTSTFIVDTDPETTVTVDQEGTYTYTWTETNGICSDNSTVVVNYYLQPIADAGVGGDACDLDFSLTGVTPANGVGLWSLTSGPGTASFDNDLSASTDVTVSSYGTYTFTWTVINGTCTDAASVTVNFYEQPTADAGLGGDICGLDFTFNAVDGVGDGLWTQTSGPGNSTFGGSASASSGVSVDAYGAYEFTWTETNGSCSDFATITVNFYEQPAADAGLGGDECDLDFTLAANANFGGEWTFTGPGTATFGSSTAASTVVTVDQSGAYTFTWTETNVVCVDSDDVIVNFYDQPVADAGTGGDECDFTFGLNAVPTFGNGTWSASGPGNASFTNAGSETSSVTVDAEGTYVFTWSVENGICTDDASVTVNFYLQPVANAGVGVDQCDLDYDLDAIGSIGTGTWTYSGPGTATFTPNANDEDATVTVDASGSYTFTWTEDNNGCTDSDSFTMNFNELPVVSFTGLDAQYCVDISTPVALVGTPLGGTFTGLGISGNMFIPSVAGVGTIFIAYEYTDVNGCTDSETQTVDVNGLPNVSFTGLDAAYCEDDASAYTLTGTPAGGTFAGFGITGDDFVPADANNGTHVISYTYVDPFGCTSFEEQSVVVNELPVVSFTGLSAAYCADAPPAPLTGSPAGGSFSGPGIVGNSFSAVVATVGTHTIVYTYSDGNGCTNTASTDVTVNPLPVPVITPSGTSEICFGTDITLDAGTGYAVYDWSNSQNGQSITVSTADDYNVTVTTFEGCVGTSADVTVVVNPNPVVDLGADTVICTGSVLNIDAGNPGATYSWSTFEVSQSINVTTTGAYSVDVTDGNGCVGSDVIAVTVSNLLDPIIVADGPIIFCEGDSVVLDAGAGFDNYLWSTGEMTQTITVTDPGVVDVIVSDQFGCSGTDDEVVSTLQLPNAVVTPAGVVEICIDDTVTLSASSTFSGYTWNPNGEATPSIDVWTAGDYTVTVTDPINGCQATSDTVTVIVNVTVQPTIVASGPTEFCQGGSVSLSVVPGPYNSYLWSSGSTTPSISVIETGDYGVTVLDANGCIDSTLLGDLFFVEVWDPQPLVAQQGDSVVVTNGPFDSYQWFYNGAPVPGATDYFHIPAASGNYFCEVTDENGCVGTSFNIEFTFTGIFNPEYAYDVDLYPNPTLGRFTLEAELGKQIDVVLTLRDIAGREVMAPEQIINVSSIRRSFDISHLERGVYYVQLSTSEGMVVKPVVRD
ncbi:T9SS type A sorting domain-containing protein, partial [Flavobacteriales bacterium]|nr:T9SS type A sorting domain-containing protein [Flavobacteriales bacterium]